MVHAPIHIPRLTSMNCVGQHVKIVLCISEPLVSHLLPQFEALIPTNSTTSVSEVSSVDAPTDSSLCLLLLATPMIRHLPAYVDDKMEQL